LLNLQRDLRQERIQPYSPKVLEGRPSTLAFPLSYMSRPTPLHHATPRIQ